MSALGRHILVEYYNCSAEVLNDVPGIETAMVNAAKEAGATIINSTFHHFSPFGVSGVVVIQESHLAIHTWPEYRYAAVDIFTCGSTVDPWVAYDFLQKAFQAESGSSMEMRRGQLKMLQRIEMDLADQRTAIEDELVEPKYNRNIWFTDKDDNMALSLRHKGDRLFKQKSPFQLVEVYDTIQYGKMLSIDNMVMCTEKDEMTYHEMIAHVPMIANPDFKRALVIGGGDGGTVRELLRHEQLEEVVMVEIDEVVVQASKEHFPSLSSAFDHPKLNLIIGDGIEYVKKAEAASFDLVIVDGSDPVGPAEGLFSESFYRDVHRILTPNGVKVAQSESPHYNSVAWQDLFRCYHSVFGKEQVHCYLAHIPTYPSGVWSFSYCAKDEAHHPFRKFDYNAAKDFCEEQGLNYYNPAVHAAAFSLPTYVKKRLNFE